MLELSSIGFGYRLNGLKAIGSFKGVPASLIEDFVLQEKLSHFDRERIPERVVHARASLAHGYFELTHSLEQFTTAGVLTAVGKKTPVIARLSTVAGSRGSADTVRDTRGFAVKFYTEQGNWDLVGNNIPVFFIQDAMKFPDLVHAVKPESDSAIPTAASAHDTFWDFVSLMPESFHHLLWIMSDRGIPRSLRMMEGFGVHTFRLINKGGDSTFVKYHWRPRLGLQTLLWDEAVKIAGADPDYHRRGRCADGCLFCRQYVFVLYRSITCTERTGFTRSYAHGCPRFPGTTCVCNFGSPRGFCGCGNKTPAGKGSRFAHEVPQQDPPDRCTPQWGDRVDRHCGKAVLLQR